MEGKEILEQQQVLNDNHCQVEENIPVCDEETMIDSVNQQIPQDNVITTNKEKQITESTVITAEDELQDIQLTKCREYDALSLIRRLRFEAELLAKAKAKEEVTVCTLQSHLQELQENREQLDKKQLNLQAFREKLQRELTVERYNRSHIEKQMSNTGEIIGTLKQNYEGLEKAYQIALKDTEKLEQNITNELQEYEAKKEIFQRAIKIDKENLQEINKVMEFENKTYNDELNIKNQTFKELYEADLKVINEIKDMKKKCDDMKHQLSNNNNSLTEVLSRNQVLKNLINSINLEELERQKNEKQQRYQETLNAMEADLNTTRESCNAAEERKAALLISLEDAVKLTNELQATDDKLENEHAALITAQEELNNNNNAIENQESNVCALESEIKAVDSNLTKLNDDISGTVQRKQEMIENLHVIQQNNQTLQTKLANLQHHAKEFTKDYELNVPKLAELQQKEVDLKSEIKNISSQVVDAKEKYLNAEKIYSNQLEKVDKELADVQIVMEQVRQESEKKIQALKEDLPNYKNELENTKQKNRENYKQKLQEMEEQLNNLQCDLKKEKENLESLKTAVRQKKVARQKLQVEFELLKVNSQVVSQKRQVLSENIRPLGILKSPGQTASSKSVSWHVPSSTSIDSNDELASRYWKSNDDIFNDLLLRMSPPERDDKPDKKRSRLD